MAIYALLNWYFFMNNSEIEEELLEYEVYFQDFPFNPKGSLLDFVMHKDWNTYVIPACI